MQVLTILEMAGHSQFSNIKYRKNFQDIKRSKEFTKLVREIIVSIKQGSSPNPEVNPRLRSAILSARKKNLPKGKIKVAIENATNNLFHKKNYEEIQYEGYGPSGTAFIIHTFTNNRSRTTSEIRYLFHHKGCNLVDTRSISYLFNHLGLVVYRIDNISFEDLFNYVIELGVLNVEKSNKDGLYFITSEIENFRKVCNALYIKFGEPEVARLTWQPKELIKISDKKLIYQLNALIEELKNNNDVQYIESNFTFIYDNFVHKL